MKKFGCLFCLLVSGHYLMAQHANNWFFGVGAGITFNSGTPVALSGSPINTFEGSTVWSDANGNLMFYSDGVTVWNKFHQVMPNGTGLLGNSSSPTSAIVVPLPGSSTLFYIFTVDYNVSSNGIRYSIVDMSLQSGNGDVQASSKNTLISGNVYEKFTLIQHRNGIDYWLVYHHHTTDKMHAHLFSASGLNMSAVVSNPGSILSGNMGQTTGTMKGSPDGCKIAMGSWLKNSFILMDFNNATGICSNVQDIMSPNFTFTYGVEFSPDGKLLYGTTSDPSKLFQFDLTSGVTATIISSAVQLATGAQNSHMGLQTGPDGKIYVARHPNSYIGCINSPNTQGTGCNFVSNAVSLGTGLSRYGLPAFLPSLFYEPVSFTDSIICDSVFFTLDNPLGASIKWTFGEPSSGSADTSLLNNPVHVYSSAGTFTVNLITTLNCRVDTISQQVSTNSFNSSLFSVSVDSCIPNATFLNLNSSATGYLWNFGDGNTSTAANPLHSYAAAGTYLVTLITNPGTLCADTSSQNVTVFGGTTASFIYQQAPCSDSVQFQNQSAGTTSYLWDFGDGNSSTSASPLHYYQAAGSYFVTLITNPGSICADTAGSLIQLTSAPVPSFTLVYDSCTPYIETVNNSAPSALDYLWFFGDGDSSHYPQPVHSYDSSGTYTITLISNPGFPCADSVSQTITLHEAPSPYFEYTSGCSDSVYFNNLSPQVTSLQWSFGDGTFSTLNSPAHWYAQPGNFTVTLSSVDSNFCLVSFTDTIQVAWNPVAAFTLNNAPCNGQISILSNSLYADSLAWNLSDGSTYSLVNPSHQFNDTGTYTVQLVAYSFSDTTVCTDTVIDTVIIQMAYPEYYVSDSTGCPPFCLQFYDATQTPATDPVIAYSWDFGDGGTLPFQNPQYCYPYPGTFEVKLKVTTQNGCQYETSDNKKIVVHPVPQANFTTQPDVPNQQVSLLNSSVGATLFTWYTGNPPLWLSDDYNSIYTPGKSGTFMVTLFAENEFGCTDSQTQEIYIPEYPVLWVPNAFSPDTDPDNPVFKAYGVGIDTYHLQIWDRWGVLVFETFDIENGWDGIYMGKAAPIDLYVYKITAESALLTEPIFKTGHLMLIR